MRPGMNLFELIYFLLCCMAAFLLGSGLASRYGLMGWIVGVPVGFVGCFGCLSILFSFAIRIEGQCRRRSRRNGDDQ
jgi:hypothetical protein